MASKGETLSEHGEDNNQEKMASKGETLSEHGEDNNQELDDDDDKMSDVPETTALNPPTAPYSPQNYPYPYYPEQPPANPGYPPGPYMYPQGPYGVQQSTQATTVIIQQPQALPPRTWSSKICECGKDWSICCCGLFCYCCLESQVVSDMNESCMLPCCVPGWLITLRTKMRMQENITGSVINDCCMVCCCPRCTLCQLAYEIKTVRQRTTASATTARPV